MDEETRPEPKPFVVETRTRFETHWVADCAFPRDDEAPKTPGENYLSWTMDALFNLAEGHIVRVDRGKVEKLVEVENPRCANCRFWSPIVGYHEKYRELGHCGAINKGPVTQEDFHCIIYREDGEG
jgi:hypothetical protein